MALLESIPAYLISILAFVGTYCLIMAYEKQYHVERVLKNGHETTGKVVEITQDPWNKEQTMVVVDYHTAGGTFKHYTQGYAQPCPYQVGQEVRVWVWPDKLRYTGKVALADEKPGKAPLILLAIGLVMCLLSYPAIAQRLMLFF